MSKVLVLGSDSRSFLTVVRSLGRRGLRVHVGWCPSHVPAARSRYIAASHGLPPYAPADDAWLRALTAVMERERFDLVVPTDDPTMIPLQIRRGDVESLGRVYLLDPAVFETVFDKVRSWELARSLDIAAPRGAIVRAPADGGRVAEMGLPVVLKPRATFAAADLVNRRSVRTAVTCEEALRHLDAMLADGDVLVQEHFAGVGAGVEVLADHGKVLVAFQHLRVHEPLRGGGSSYRKSVPLDGTLRQATERLMAALEYTGVAMVEFKVNPRTGEWRFMEINGRFWGSLPLAVAAGADFPYYLYQLLVHGRREFPRHYRTGLYCRNWWLDAVWLRENLRADRSDPTLHTVPLRRVAGEVFNILAGRERSDTLVLDDPRPAAAELRHLLGAARRRAQGKAGLALVRLPFARRLYRRRAEALLRQARSILFVCKGNICRSPFAQAYARQHFPDTVEALSCGYYPREGRLCPPEAVEAARTLGIDLAQHRSRTISAEQVRRADLIFVFDGEDLRTVTERFPWAQDKTHLLGIVAGNGAWVIRDPFGRDRETFRATYDAIARAVTACRDVVAGNG